MVNPLMKTCLLLPAYNESRTIGRIIQEASLFVGRIIVVDDGSSDNTAEIAGAGSAMVLRHTRNLGKGRALRTGFDYAVQNGYELIVTMDSDGQHNLMDLPRFFDRFRQTGADILIGERLEGRSTMPLHRRLNNWLVSTVGSALCGQKVPDFQSGYRLIRAEVLKAVCLETERYETESEFLIQAGRLGFRIESTPIQVIYGNEISNVKPLREMPLFTKLLVKSLREK
jgi:glycosyltransferase involved in cell wall biosynthesis